MAYKICAHVKQVKVILPPKTSKPFPFSLIWLVQVAFSVALGIVRRILLFYFLFIIVGSDFADIWTLEGEELELRCLPLAGGPSCGVAA